MSKEIWDKLLFSYKIGIDSAMGHGIFIEKFWKTKYICKVSDSYLCKTGGFKHYKDIPCFASALPIGEFVFDTREEIIELYIKEFGRKDLVPQLYGYGK